MAPHLLATIADPIRRLLALLRSLRQEHPQVTQLKNAREMFMKNLHSVDLDRQNMLRNSRERFLKTLLRLQKIPLQQWSTPPLATTQRPCVMRACAPASPTARALRVCLSEGAFGWLLGHTPPPTTADARHALIREVAVAEGMLFDLAAQLMRVHGELQQQLDALAHALDQRDAGKRSSSPLGPLVAAVLRCQHDLHAPDQPLPVPKPISMAA